MQIANCMLRWLCGIQRFFFVFEINSKIYFIVDYWPNLIRDLYQNPVLDFELLLTVVRHLASAILY